MVLRPHTTGQSGLKSPAVFGGVSLSLCHSVEEAFAPWSALEASGFSTIYQSLLWAKTWEGSDLARGRVSSKIVIGHSNAGEELFVLPLQARRLRGVTMLEFMSSPLASYGHLVCSHWCFSEAGQAWFQSHALAIFSLCEPYDLVDLRDMPSGFDGHKHPLASHFNLRGANTALTGHVSGTFDEFVKARRGSDSRKNMRWKDAKLAQAGDLQFHSALSGEALHQAADELFADQGRRLVEAGVRDPFGPAERAFFHELISTHSDQTRFSVLRLSIDGSGLSSIMAGFHGDTCSDLMTSLANSPLRKYSPGDLVLRKLIGLCCENGYRQLDLGIGDHDYKRVWAGNELELFHLVKGRTLKGICVAAFIYATQSLARVIKGNKTLRSWFNASRRYLRGTRP
jgi:CelD/BcsL family acetyltransferase involved in cellulose biosynthesis